MKKTSATYLNTYKLNLNKEVSSGKVVLPVPAVYILNKEGLVQYSYQHINYKVRLQPKIAAVGRTTGQTSQRITFTKNPIFLHIHPKLIQGSSNCPETQARIELKFH